MKLWIYLEKEICDLMPSFEKAFGVNNLYYDNENVYEWIESKDSSSAFYLNIARTHNGETGDYEQPIMIIIKSNSDEDLDEADIANRIKNELNCKVYTGKISVDEDDKAITIPKRIY